jgi:DNA-binding response OmpR family regulator
MAAAKIMVVDDEPDVVQAVSLRLKAAGYDVIQARDGVAATHAAVKEQPNLIILDIGMPAGDGHTVATRLKTNPKTFHIPVIFLTARSSETDIRKAADAGVVGYLVKPCKPQRLLSMVERALSESGSRGGRSADGRAA